MTQLTTCIWYDHTAEEAANFYASVLPGSRVIAVNRTPSDTPSQKAGDVITVDFEVAGQKFIGLNGGPIFPQTEAVSFMLFTEDQEETDRPWNAIVGNGGRESACGWCKDKWGVNWQITPKRLMDLIWNNADPASAKRAMDAMLTMHKIDIATVEAAAAGTPVDA
ncbi:VOC family protein [Sphingomonas koreensis]|uniref:VOC family protein n=1 Tax=Sphingomonas koreensis TaxID=93064 RepID=UPI000F7F55D3|nr:VOC family protein [Sphingomonas koreensis]RSY09334.1 VOC family protein [Sphingomonas koreensis]RSY17143.1 VOC family protein [Sphingomonas koreensis]RSY23534.1 VOC family protein [Sphingomonas koreensis]RSY24575.1 VOC family protein [Sphingomonas koreensis]RSY29986.1 VOC family protein [Sphingomonas koreensis]